MYNNKQVASTSSDTFSLVVHHFSLKWKEFYLKKEVFEELGLQEILTQEILTIEFRDS